MTFTIVYVGLAIIIPILTYAVCEFAIQEWSPALRKYGGMALGLAGALVLVGAVVMAVRGEATFSGILYMVVAALCLAGFGMVLRGAPQKT